MSKREAASDYLYWALLAHRLGNPKLAALYRRWAKGLYQ